MPTETDFDFIVEKAKPIKLPAGWEIKDNSYGNPKLIGPNYVIDYIPLENIHSIKRRGLPPTIENFLTGTPLNIQSIAFDVANNKVIGEIGLKSIRDKTVSINNPEQAQIRADKRKLAPEDLVKDIASQFGFNYRVKLDK